MSDRTLELRLLSLLLGYPDAELIALRPQLAAEAAGMNSAAATWIERFLAETAELEPAKLEGEYVETFDFAKRCGLHLTYHRYGERRERGMALLALKQRYAAAGLELAEGELPDYLPAMLDFAALRPEIGEDLLLENREAIELVRAALRDRESPYAHLLDGVRACLPRLTARQLAAVKRLASEGPPPPDEVGLEPFAPPEMMPAAGPPPPSGTPGRDGWRPTTPPGAGSTRVPAGRSSAAAATDPSAIQTRNGGGKP